MLKKRSKTVSSKQGGVTPHSFSLSSLTGNLTHKPCSSSLFSFLNPILRFSPNQFSDHVKCPNLKFKSFSSVCNPFDRKATIFTNNGLEFKSPRWDGRFCNIVGLAIVNALSNDEKKSLVAENQSVSCGSLLKVQIPSTSKSSHCPIEFGVKNKESKLAISLLSPGMKSPLFSINPSVDNSQKDLCLSASEIELSEDYTCVISHGLHEKKTHIFDNNIILESWGNGFSSLEKIRLPSDQSGGHASDCFLSFCHSCRNRFVQGDDVFIYRGEEAFCSQECRNREIIYQEGREHS